ncbi:MAG: acyl-CoA transferase [Azospirillum sp.]|nr:acyl-CoA transferase [Azospirillum sp.]
MAHSVRETALRALLAALQTVPAATVERETVVPERVPAGGLLILRDGEAGEPVDVVMSPLIYCYEHLAQIEAVVQSSNGEKRARTLDDLLRALGAALAADRTLGETVEWFEWAAPHTDDLAVPFGATIKGAVVPVTLIYSIAEDPLS